MSNIDISKQKGVVKDILEAKEKDEKQGGLINLTQVPKNNDDWKSAEIGELAGALAKAQSEMEGAQKDSTNPFFNSSYADLHSVVKSSFPYLSKYGLSVSQGNEMIQSHVCVTTTLMHSSGQWLRSKIKLPLEKKNAQGVGSAITYGRRYGLSAMVGIAQFDDDANSIS